MPRPDESYDYTQDDAIHSAIDAADGTGGRKAGEFDDYVIQVSDDAYTKSADEIEKENGFQDIPPGEHELEITGLVGKPESVRKTMYVGSRRVDFTSIAVSLKLSLPGNPRANVTDYFLFPPATSAEAAGYYEGTKNPGKGAAGFWAGKLYHFLERAGFTIVKGKRLPDECLRFGNYWGRRVVATIEAGKPYMDQVTGEEKPGRPGIKLYSYRPAGSPLAATPAAPSPTQAVPATPPPVALLKGLENV